MLIKAIPVLLPVQNSGGIRSCSHVTTQQVLEYNAKSDFLSSL